MEIIPDGQSLGARIERTVHNAVADDTATEPRAMRRIQVTTALDSPAPVA